MHVLALSDAEKLGSFDVVLVVGFLASGVFVLINRKRQISVRMARVKRGEITAHEAENQARVQSWLGYSLVVLSALLLGLHFTAI